MARLIRASLLNIPYSSTVSHRRKTQEALDIIDSWCREILESKKESFAEYVNGIQGYISPFVKNKGIFLELGNSILQTRYWAPRVIQMTKMFPGNYSEAEIFILEQIMADLINLQIMFLYGASVVAQLYRLYGLEPHLLGIREIFHPYQLSNIGETLGLVQGALISAGKHAMDRSDIGMYPPTYRLRHSHGHYFLSKQQIESIHIN